MKKNVLLTGGSGYIGSWFVEKYSKNYNIKILDTVFFNNHLSKKNIQKFIKKDIRKINLEDLADVDIVVHMAELSNDPLGEINKDLTFEINVLGTKRLIELAKKAQIKKFIYMSSCSVYGDSGDTVANEEIKTNPLTEYAKAKYANEQFLLNNDFDFEIKILRNATAFGYSPNTRTDLVINDLSVAALNKKQINVLSDGTPRRPFVHIGDICRFINFLMCEDNKKKLLVNVGSDKLNHTVKEVAEIISRLTDVPNVSFGKSNSDARSYFVDFRKLSKLYPEFKFIYTVEEGVKEIQKNIELINKNIFNSKRIKKINYLLDEKLIDDSLFWNINKK